VNAPLIVLGMFAACSLAAAIWGLFLLGPRSVTPVTFDRQAYGTMMAFSLPLILSSWAGLFGTNWFDYIVIKQYRPFAEVGLYSLGCLMAGVVQQVTIIFSTLLVPQFSVMVAQGEHEKIAAFVGRVLPYWFLATSVLLMLVLLVAGPIVPLVFGEAFRESVPVLALLVLATCALALFNAFSPLVVAFGSTWVLSGICLVSGGVNVLMDFALIPSYGIAGAAFATVLAYATSALLVLVFVQTRVQARVVGLGVLALPVALVCLCFFLLQGLWFYALAIPAGMLSVYWLVGRFGLFGPEDAVFLQGLRLPAVLLGRVP
jgi:O-antigen/teichoic acid export membrane protein